MPMTHETDLLSFLHEAIELRIRAISEQANHNPGFVKVNQKMLDFMENVTDEGIRATLLKYEALKSDYIALLMPHLYEAGLKDGLAIYGLLQRFNLCQ